MAIDEAEQALPLSALLTRIADLEAALAARDEALAARDEALAERDAKIAELQALVGTLVSRTEELSEKVDRNSGNSNRPPSSDGPGAASRSRRHRKSPTGRKRGGQKGRRGACRVLLPAERADAVLDFYPDACERCAASLPRTPDAAARRYQLLDLVDWRVHLTEFRRHEVECGRCGHWTLAPRDAGEIPASSFGPRLVATVVLLTGVYHLSRRQAQQLLHELLGIEVSLGSVSNMEARASAALQIPSEQAERAVRQAEVKHADGTTWLRAGVTKAMWTLASTTVIVYRIFANGQRDTIRALFGTLKGILVSDRAKVLTFWPMQLRQICWAHLVRKFVSFSERDGPAGAIGRVLLDYAALVFDYWHGFVSGQLTRDELAAWMRPVQQQFEAALERAVDADIARLSGSCADILAHRDALWLFVTHDGVEPTNNYAERVLRGLVLWRRRSFGCQSDRGDRFVERVTTVVQTLRRGGRGVLDFLVRCVTAHADGAAPPVLVEA